MVNTEIANHRALLGTCDQREQIRIRSSRKQDIVIGLF